MNITGREVVVFGLVVLVVLAGGLVLLSLFWGLNGMGFGMMGPGMMGGFGLLWWLLGCLAPLGLLVLLVAGAVWLLAATRAASGGAQPPAERCPNCGQPVQANWRVCPNCGTPLREEDAG